MLCERRIADRQIAANQDCNLLRVRLRWLCVCRHKSSALGYPVLPSRRIGSFKNEQPPCCASLRGVGGFVGNYDDPSRHRCKILFTKSRNLVISNPQSTLAHCRIDARLGDPYRACVRHPAMVRPLTYPRRDSSEYRPRCSLKPSAWHCRYRRPTPREACRSLPLRIRWAQEERQSIHTGKPTS